MSAFPDVKLNFENTKIIYIFQYDLTESVIFSSYRSKNITSSRYFLTLDNFNNGIEGRLWFILTVEQHRIVGSSSYGHVAAP